MANHSHDIRAIPHGHVLSDYKFEEVLGQGSFGITYLATDTMLNKRVAIKEYFPREFAARDSTLTVRAAGNSDDRDNFIWGLKRFLDEARVLAVFDHPNIIQVRRFFEANGTAYLVMDYCDGTPLDELLKTNGTLDESGLEVLLKPLLDALELIHNTNFLHRDIKPANIFIKNDGTPVLLDFGAARQELVSHSKSVTAMATPGYAAFEQYSSHGNQGPWTDIYGLGATIYKAITGSKPEDATNRMLEDTLVPCSEICSGKFRPQVLNAIDAAMCVKPADRPQNISEWRSMFGFSRQTDNQIKTKLAPDTISIDIKPNSSNLNVDDLKIITKPKKSSAKTAFVANKQYVYGAGLFLLLGILSTFFLIRDDANSLSNKPDEVTPVAILENKTTNQAPEVKPDVKPVPDRKEPQIEVPKKADNSKPNCSKELTISSWNNCIGTHRYPSGATYSGEWLSGRRSGYGTGVSNNGNKYVGNWLNDVFHGYGVLSFSAGDEYKGEFKNGFFSGKGLYVWVSGDRHEGYYENGTANGRGTYYFKGGRKYVGNFVNGKFDGQGTMYDPSGRVVYSGTWNNGNTEASTATTSSARENNLSQCKLAAINAKKTTKLPYKVDEVTTLVDMFCDITSGDKAVYIYKYEVQTSQNVDQDFLDKNVREINKKLVCGPELKIYLPIVDFEYQYIYSRSTANYAPGRVIGKLRYSSSDCR